VAYQIEFDEAVSGHLRYLTARERSIVFAAIETQLAYEPLTETRNRKPLRPNPIAPWELRVRKRHRSDHRDRAQARERRYHGRQGDSPVEHMTLSAAVRPLGDYVRELGDEVLVLTKRRRPVVAVIPLKNVDRETLALSCNAEFLQIVAEARARFSAGRKLSLDEVKRAVLPKRPRGPRRQPASIRAR
jgi:hypothetical protein